ncbi:hypothetical protein MSTO_15250 [Mycobacterium stomatepiae]|uniref:Uncharacterized protein n=1 Tax=Mycobacterium stomatepiae TaxID=470076 RepID=A0A7I7Q4P2_9MYCO|nr:hypothetical protein MSTO_15250 [Mycobacterium stomatepiae]
MYSSWRRYIAESRTCQHAGDSGSSCTPWNITIASMSRWRRRANAGTPAAQSNPAAKFFTVSRIAAGARSISRAINWGTLATVADPARQQALPIVAVAHRGGGRLLFVHVKVRE